MLVWAREGDPLPERGRAVKLAEGEPQRILLERLAPDTRYVYELRDAASKQRVLPDDGPGAFRTARAAGRPFTFTVQADSHLDEACSPELYRRTLANALADAPDFHVDLGDTFMTEKHATRESAERQYLSQRYHLGLIGRSAPIFLVLGNHDGEARGPREANGELALWSLGMRKRFFPNPEPDGFYTGNPERLDGAGVLENWYAWEWGDALFVALDPYWTSAPNRGGREPWNATLGKAQYDWLAATLARSRAAHKLVFVHQLTGSYHASGRGGAEAAVYQEWGGKELDGSEGFAQHRPGWELPIHRLLVKHGVELVFHGHDHFYARQELDGVVYQLVPQPAHRNARSHHAQEYGYSRGEFLPSSGHLRVTVAPESLLVEYVRAGLPEHERQGVRNGTLAASYRIKGPKR